MMDIGKLKEKEALRAKIDADVAAFIAAGGKIETPEINQVVDVKVDVLERMDVGRHFVTPDARENER
jgi:hypothetical protein